MDRVAAQQARPLLQVPLRGPLHDHGPQPPLVAAAAAVDQDARQHAADPAEAVEDHVARLRPQELLAGVEAPQLRPQEGLEILARRLVLVAQRELADVDAGGGRLQLSEGREHLRAQFDRQLAVEEVAREPVRLEDVDRRAAHQGAAEDRHHHPVLAVELADDRDHALGDRFPLNPFPEVRLGLLVPHDDPRSRGPVSVFKIPLPPLPVLSASPPHLYYAFCDPAVPRWGQPASELEPGSAGPCTRPLTISTPASPKSRTGGTPSSAAGSTAASPRSCAPTSTRSPDRSERRRDPATTSGTRSRARSWGASPPTPAAIELGRLLLGGDPELRMREQVLIRSDPEPPPYARELGYHIDAAFCGAEFEAVPKQVYYQMLHYLSTVKPGGGGVHIVPGSHRFSCAALFGGDPGRDTRPLDSNTSGAGHRDDGVEICAEEGDLILFNPLCFHSASQNRTDRPRYVYFTSFYDTSGGAADRVRPPHRLPRPVPRLAAAGAAAGAAPPARPLTARVDCLPA